MSAPNQGVCFTEDFLPKKEFKSLGSKMSRVERHVPPGQKPKGKADIPSAAQNARLPTKTSQKVGLGGVSPGSNPGAPRESAGHDFDVKVEARGIVNSSRVGRSNCPG